MGKSFQFNNRKETEKTEDVINTLVSATLPLTTTYDDTANTLTLAVETGGDDGDLLKVGSADITADQFIKMKANGDVVGVNTGKDANELLKVGSADITTGQLLGMNNDGGVGGVNTGKDANELLKVGSIEINGVLTSEITSGQLLIMNGEEVIGKTIGNLQSNILQNGADLTAGHILKMSGSQVIGEASGVAQDNILVSAGNIADDDYLYNDDGDIKGRTIDGSVVSLLKAGDVVIDGVLNTDGDENLVLKRNDATKLTISSTFTRVADDTHFQGSIFQCASCGINDNSFLIPLQINDGANPNMNSNAYKRFRWQFSNIAGPNGGGVITHDTSIYAKHSIITRQYFTSHVGNLNTSDDRIKSEETPIENATDTLLKITPKNYFKHPDYRVDEDDESPIPEKDLSGNVIMKIWESGIIAQELYSNAPELRHLLRGDFNPETDEDTLTMNYTGLIAFLVKSVQELNQRIVELESK